MFKKEVTFKSPQTGDEQKVVLYFHLTQYEAIRLVGEKGDWEEYVQKLQANLTFNDVRKEMEEIILTAYGEKINDRFVKQVDGNLLRNDFEYSEAFSSLMVGFILDVNSWIEFMTNLAPKEEKATTETSTATGENQGPTLAKEWT